MGETLIMPIRNSINVPLLPTHRIKNSAVLLAAFSRGQPGVKAMKGITIHWRTAKGSQLWRKTTVLDEDQKLYISQVRKDLKTREIFSKEAGRPQAQRRLTKTNTPLDWNIKVCNIVQCEVDKFLNPQHLRTNLNHKVKYQPKQLHKFPNSLFGRLNQVSHVQMTQIL